jgi:predicted RNase H-like HicB family nuclease
MADGDHGNPFLQVWESFMKYTVLVEESDEGFAVSVPGLPGCHSQGDTEAEALANIADAIREYREVVQELARTAGAKAIEVEV